MKKQTKTGSEKGFRVIKETGCIERTPKGESQKSG